MDEQSYLQRVQECERSLYRIARSILYNDMDCADAVQQAVFQGWINRRKLRDAEKFRSWLTAILVNECRNLQRRQLRQKNVVQAIGNRIQTETPPINDPELAEAIRELPEQYRLPILLHYMEGYSIREIAGILRVTERRVTDCLYRARRKLEEALSDEE